MLNIKRENPANQTALALYPKTTDTIVHKLLAVHYFSLYMNRTFV